MCFEYEWEKIYIQHLNLMLNVFVFMNLLIRWTNYTGLVTLYLVAILATEGPEVNKLLKILAFMDFTLNSNNLLKFKTWDDLKKEIHR